MPDDATISIAVTNEELAGIRAAIAAGEYGSPADILREALADWHRKRQAHLPDTAWLRAAWEEGLRSEAQDYDLAAILAEARKAGPAA